MWNLRNVTYVEIDEVTLDIFDKYKYALAYIGVDFDREDVQDAVIDCSQGMEEAFQATIVYWQWKSKQKEDFYPSAALIDALNKSWKPKYWQEEYLNNPNFKSPYTLWWEQVGEKWGNDVRNQLIADVHDTGHIEFMSGDKLRFSVAEAWGWERVLNYARQSCNRLSNGNYQYKFNNARGKNK